MPALAIGTLTSRPDDHVVIASGLNFPTGVTFDEHGTGYVAESGLSLAGLPTGGRILRVEEDGRLVCLKEGLRAPVNGVTYWRGWLYISEGGTPGRISALNSTTNQWRVILDGLPGGGNYHTNSVAVGPEGKLYFGQGSATNSGIAGPDSLELSWLRKVLHPHDIPGRNVILTGANVATSDPSRGGQIVRTGAFQPFGTPTISQQRLDGQLPCTSAIMCCDPDGANLRLVAWGFRNPYGLAFLPNGRLLAIDLGFNDRGSRPVGNGPSCLYEVTPGAWYGWPDFVAGLPITDPRYCSKRGDVPRFLLANHDELGPPQQPLALFEPRHAPTRMTYLPESRELVIALFGDKRPVTGPEGPPVGRCIVRMRISDGKLRTVAGPLLHRPIDVTYHLQTRSLWVLDFGQFELKSGGEVAAQTGTGALWRFPTPR